MAIDWTGGLADGCEFFLAEAPGNPEMRDSVSFRLFDDRGEIGLPRFGIEAVGCNWGKHEVQMNLAFPDGRVFRTWQPFANRTPIDPDGRCRSLAAGPLCFRCEEPFRRWTAQYEGLATATNVDRLIAGSNEGPLVDLAFHVDATMVAPPWFNGQLLPEAAKILQSSDEADAMGGNRYEQLFRAKVEVRIDDAIYDFQGSGVRVRRQGVRRVDSEFWGSIIQSAVFPSGRGFGYQAYPDREDGRKSYNEGYVFMGDGALIAARAKSIPWASGLIPSGEDVSCVLETELGDIRIEGKSVLSSFDVALADLPVLHQSNVKYTWEGESAYGMIERVTPGRNLRRA